MNRLEDVLAEFKAMMPRFEVRDEQHEMMQNVYQMMKSEGKIAVHAPTGTGKTLGYLIPYVAMKLENSEYKITISTNTISLQEQIFKDIEMANQIYKKLSGMKNLSWTTLKGKSNYFCEERFLESETGNVLDSRLFEMIKKRVNQLKNKKERVDQQHIGIKMSSKNWDEINVETCKENKCPFRRGCTYFQDYFFPYDILIINHHLFFTMSFYGEDYWKNIDFYIFDESHKIEKTMLDVITPTFSEEILKQWVAKAERVAQKFNLDSKKFEQWERETLLLNDNLDKISDFLDGISQKIEVFYEQQKNKYNSKDGVKTAFLKQLNIKLSQFKEFLSNYEAWNRNAVEQFCDLFLPETRKDKKFDDEIENWVNFLSRYVYFSRYKEWMLWAEKTKKGEIFLKITPRFLKELSHSFSKGLLFTSGTLEQEGTCRTFASRLNVELDKDLVLPSPFLLPEQTIVYVAEGLDPKENEKYQAGLEPEILSLLKCGTLKSFVLFTSVKLMENMYKKLQKEIETMENPWNQPVEVWLQNKTNHKEIMQSFSNLSTRTVLFGTLTYFEGIDLKGEALTQIILTKLPYAVPTHPVQQILDSTSSFSEWEALIRQEQAFGRIVRTKNDYGSFSVLDNRAYKFKKFLEMFYKEGIKVTSDIQEVKKFYKSWM